VSEPTDFATASKDQLKRVLHARAYVVPRLLIAPRQEPIGGARVERECERCKVKIQLIAALLARYGDDVELSCYPCLQRRLRDDESRRYRLA